MQMLEDLTRKFEMAKMKVDDCGELVVVKQSIFATIRAGSVFQLEQYLSSGLFSVHERDYQNCSPLHIAAHEGREDMICVLIAHGADVFATDTKGRTAKDIADKHRYSSISKKLLSLMSDLKGIEMKEENPLQSPLLSHSELEPLTHALSSLSVNMPFGTLNELRPSNFCTVSDDHSLILCLVGLPGRGKSFISRRLARYLNWKGVPCRVFNVGDYRRKFLGVAGTSSADFFDPSNKAAKDAREKMAEFATEDLIDFIHSHPICVGILDATNTTRERRALLLERFKAMKKTDPSLPSSHDAFGIQPTTVVSTPVRVVFVESICHNEDIITENILRAKCGNEDFKGVSPQTVIAEFRERIGQYEKVYESLDTSENGGRVSFIQIIDAKQRIVLHNVRGALPSRVSYFLMSLHPVAYPVFVTLPAETFGDVAGQFGGDSRLTQNGVEFTQRLRSFIKARMTTKTGNASLRILCSYSPAVEQTVRAVLGGVDGEETLNVTTIPLRALDDINYGAMAGLTKEEAFQRHPKTSGLLFQNKEPNLDPPTRHESRESQAEMCPHDCPELPMFAYTVSFVRGGESARQVNVRIEPALLEIMRADGPVIVIANPTPAKGVLAFITDELPEHSQAMFIPRHGVIEVGVKSNKIIHYL